MNPDSGVELLSGPMVLETVLETENTLDTLCVAKLP